MQQQMKYQEADDRSGGADDPELEELPDAAPIEEGGQRAHASQYQSAKSTVNRPSKGKNSDTMAELTIGRRPHSARSMNAGNMTKAKRGMLMRLEVDIGTSKDAAKYKAYDGRSARNEMIISTKNATVKTSSMRWLTVVGDATAAVDAICQLMRDPDRIEAMGRRARARVVSQFSRDLASGNAADYTWISPDQCHDMHGRGSTPDDPCDFSQVPALIATGDTFLLNTVNAIMNSRAWTGNSVIFMVWDESDFTGNGFQGFGDDRGCCDSVPGLGGGQVVMVTISHSDHSPRTSDVAYNHQSMLATIEDGWELGCLAFTCDTANVPPMSDLVGPKK